jgi:hypothetical protein
MRPSSARPDWRPRFHIDLQGAVLAPDVARAIPVGDAFVAAVGITSLPGPRTRVVLDLTRGDRTVVIRTGAPGVILEVVPEWASEAGSHSSPPRALTLPPPGFMPEPAPQLKAVEASADALPARLAEQLRSTGVPRVNRPPRLEEFLEGGEPHLGLAVRDFRQREPGDGTPVSRQTVAYLAYDDTNLYCVFVCQDDPAKVRAYLGKRDSLEDSDQVALYLDTFHDRRRAYVFAVNPRGIQKDTVLTDGAGSDLTFDAIWSADGRVTNTGFVVWMAIPFKSFRFASGPDQIWGIALGRYIAHANESAVWPLVSRNRQGFVRQMAAVPAPRPSSSGSSLQLIPYAAYTQSRVLAGGSEPVTASEERTGLDAKLVLRDAFSFDATFNPDFSSVESDAPQVTENRRYEVYFPEKRPFFLESAGLFRTPVNLFFSRRILEPRVGLRVTAKSGPWSMAALAADDPGRGRRLEEGQPLRGESAIVGVMRLQREFGTRASLGILATGYSFGPSSNGVLSLDTRVRLGANWSFTGQAIGTGTRQADGPWLFGPGFSTQLARSGQHFEYSAGYSDRSPRFHAELGYVPRVDLRQASQYFGYFWRPQGSALTSFGPGLSAAVTYDHNGVLQDWYVNPEVRIELTGPTGFQVGRFEAQELYLGSTFRYDRTYLSFYSSPSNWLLIYGALGKGTGINYAPAPGLAPFLGNAPDASFGLRLRPTPELAFDLLYYYSALTLPREPGSASAGAPVFDNHLLQAKLNWQFSRALSARLILDYSAFSPNPSLYAGEPYQGLTGDVLIAWMLNPGTAFYLGYTNRDVSAVIDGVLPALRRTFSPSQAQERQLFVKLSYSFRR